MKLYNFGADIRGRQDGTLKPLAWPINAWTCYIPDNVNPELNILERLILSLVGKGVSRTTGEIKDILVRQIGMNGDLIDNVLSDCSKNYFDNRRKAELALNAHAKMLLEAIEGEVSPEMQMSDFSKRIYLIQDAVTGAVVPCFNVDRLPEFADLSVEEGSFIPLQTVSTAQPKTAAIANALRQWGKVRRAIENDEIPQDNHVEMGAEFSDFGEDDFGTEVALEEISPNVMEKTEWVDSVTLYDDAPRPFFAAAYVAFNPNNPTEIEIISPLGRAYDNWFMKIANRLRACDERFAEDLQMFLMEKTELFKDKIAYGNDMGIQLFDDYPAICNDAAYADLNKAIRDLSKDLLRIRNGEDESTNFAKNLRTALEVVFRTAVNAHPEIKEQKKEYRSLEFRQGFERYRMKIRRVAEANRLDDAVKQRFINQNIYRNVTDLRQGNPKDNAALILLYASETPANFATRFVIDYCYIFTELFDLYHLGTDAGHAGTNFTTMYLSPPEAEMRYSQFEGIVRAIFSHFIEGGN